jgi:hypothetical protein
MGRVMSLDYKMENKNMNKGRREFDYYIYIDYSENLIGYIIVEREKIGELLPKLTKLHHYKDIEHKKEYLSSIKERFKRDKIIEFIFKYKIKEMRLNVEIFIDVIEFIKKNDNCFILLSVDNNQYNSFMKLLKLIPHRENLLVLKENDLKKSSLEYRLSLIIDTMLNLERRKLK